MVEYIVEKINKSLKKLQKSDLAVLVRKISSEDGLERTKNYWVESSKSKVKSVKKRDDEVFRVRHPLLDATRKCKYVIEDLYTLRGEVRVKVALKYDKYISQDSMETESDYVARFFERIVENSSGQAVTQEDLEGIIGQDLDEVMSAELAGYRAEELNESKFKSMRGIIRSKLDEEMAIYGLTIIHLETVRLDNEYLRKQRQKQKAEIELLEAKLKESIIKAQTRLEEAKREYKVACEMRSPENIKRSTDAQLKKEKVRASFSGMLGAAKEAGLDLSGDVQTVNIVNTEVGYFGGSIDKRELSILKSLKSTKKSKSEKK